MSIYDDIEAKAARRDGSKRTRVLAVLLAAAAVFGVGTRMWLNRPPAPPTLASYEDIDGVVAAKFGDGTLALTVGTDVAALDKGQRTEWVLAVLEQTGALEYTVMELRDTAGTVVGRAWPDGRIKVRD